METYLTGLSISNLALIDDITLGFEQGLNVITGPTGSGKTMLIQALKLAFGERADYDLLRETEDAGITAHFKLSEDQEVPFSQGESSELSFERKLKQNRSSPAYVNGERVRLKELRNNRTELIDFHGQHDNQAVFKNDFPRVVLDRYGDHRDALEDYRSRYRTYRELESELESLQGDQSQLEQRLELLNYQLSELDEFSPEENEWEEIEERRLKLESTEEIEQKLQSALELLEGDSDLANELDRLRNWVEELIEYEQDLENWSQELEGASVMVEELRRELRELRETLAGSGQDYDDLMNRRSRWMELSRKHNVPPENLHRKYSELKQEKNNLENREKRKQELTNEIETLEDDLYDLGEQLHDHRVECAESLESTVDETLRRLNLENAVFQIELGKKELGPAGFDEVRWLFSSHDSQPVGPFSTRVSGGEISRVLLAIKSALAGADRTSVLVFDEIDTGISGEEARRVGDVLKELSQYHQVLCITHLPLVASWADNHILVNRQDRDQTVDVAADVLDRSDRIEELSRLLSGNESSDVSRQQAEELLDDNS